MYEAFYGLNEKPFNLTPDPRFLYLSSKHKEAFAHLLYGIRNRCGFVMVSGEIGTGKTTICRSLLKQLDPDTEVAFIFNPKLSPVELLQTINSDFGIQSKADTVRGLIQELNAYLLDRSSKGKNCVLIIDEAQNLGTETLEQIRLLSNLETETEKLLQIVLIGQPELAQKLELVELRQLNQRITARYHLGTLSSDETLHYIAFRLRVAGGRKKVKFTRAAVRTVHRISGGTPRVINALCDRALLIGYTKESRNITPAIVRKSAAEIQGAGRPGSSYGRFRRLVPASIVAVAAVAAIMAALWLPKYDFSLNLPSWNSEPPAHTAKQNEAPVAPVTKPVEKPAAAPKANTAEPSAAHVAPRGIAEAASVAPAVAPEATVKTESAPAISKSAKAAVDEAEKELRKLGAAVKEAPKPEVPKAEVAKPEASKVEAPKADAPKADATKTEAAKPEVIAAAPAVEAPKPDEAAKAVEIAKADTSKVDTSKSEPTAPEPAKVEAPVAEVSKQDAAPVAAAPEPEKVASATPAVTEAPNDEPPAPAAAKSHAGLAAVVRAWDFAVRQSPPMDVTWSTIVKFATANGLRAISMSPNTTQIAAIDLPVIVRMKKGNGLEWVTVTAFERSTIHVLHGDGTEEDMNPDAFRKAYTGDAFYLWNDPDPSAEPIRARTEGENVTELQSDLKKLGLLDSDPTGTYDVPTIDAISRIQRATGIAVDGVAGQQTRMVLTSWLDRAGAPSLSKAGFTDSLRARILANPGIVPGASAELQSIPLPEKVPAAQAPAPDATPADAASEAPGL